MYPVSTDPSLDLAALVDGKALAAALATLDDLAAGAGVAGPTSFATGPDGWFPAQRGLDWLDAFLPVVRASPEVPNQHAVLGDLLDLRQALQQARDAGAAWRLTVDG